MASGIRVARPPRTSRLPSTCQPRNQSGTPMRVSLASGPVPSSRACRAGSACRAAPTVTLSNGRVVSNPLATLIRFAGGDRTARQIHLPAFQSSTSSFANGSVRPMDGAGRRRGLQRPTATPISMRVRRQSAVQHGVRQAATARHHAARWSGSTSPSDARACCRWTA